MHVQTADYCDPQTAAQLAPYLTFDYACSGQYVPTHNAGIKTVAYEDPFEPNGGDWIEIAALKKFPDIEAKTCTGQTVQTYHGTGYFADLSKPDAVAYVQWIVDTRDAYLGTQPDAIFFDNANNLYQANAQPCSYVSPAQWTALVVSVLSRINTHGAQLYLNTLSTPESYEDPPPGVTYQNQIAGLAASTETGGEYEASYVDGAQNWIATEDTEISTIAAGRTFWAYADGSWSTQQADSPAAIAQRMFVYASFLLTYDPNFTIFQEWLQTKSTVKVFPETGFVALQPAYRASDVSNYHYSGGAYERFYNACYAWQVYVGHCAVAVNPGASSVPIQYASGLNHSLVISGSDVLDGGSIDVKGPAVTTVAPGAAAILTP